MTSLRNQKTMEFELLHKDLRLSFRPEHQKSVLYRRFRSDLTRYLSKERKKSKVLRIRLLQRVNLDGFIPSLRLAN